MFNSKFNLVFEEIITSLKSKKSNSIPKTDVEDESENISKDKKSYKEVSEMLRKIKDILHETITFKDIEPFIQIPANEIIYKMIQEAIIKERFIDGSFTNEEKTKILDEISKHEGKSDIGFLIAKSKYASPEALANVFNNIKNSDSGYDFRIYSALVSNKNTPRHIVYHINDHYKKYLPML